MGIRRDRIRNQEGRRKNDLDDAFNSIMHTKARRSHSVPTGDTFPGNLSYTQKRGCSNSTSNHRKTNVRKIRASSYMS